jgi:hypothetical protein
MMMILDVSAQCTYTGALLDLHTPLDMNPFCYMSSLGGESYQLIFWLARALSRSACSTC